MDLLKNCLDYIHPVEGDGRILGSRYGRFYCIGFPWPWLDLVLHSQTAFLAWGIIVLFLKKRSNCTRLDLTTETQFPMSLNSIANILSLQLDNIIFANKAHLKHPDNLLQLHNLDSTPMLNMATV